MAKQYSILVVIDPTSEDQIALARAVAFTEHIHANLVLFANIFNPDIAHVQWVTGQSLDHLRAAALEEVFQALEQMAEPLRQAGKNVSCKVAWDSPLHEAIVREALLIEADFVIKATHHHSAISRALFTNTDWHLIRECPAALWLVKPTPDRDDATVMAAVDPTHEHDQTAALDHRILQTAQLLATLFEERLELVHIFEPPPPPMLGVYPAAAPVAAASNSDLVNEARAAHLLALQNLAADGGFPAAQVHLREGQRVAKLPAAADELKAGIVVMGAITRSRIDRAIVGHTAEQTLEFFPCDIVVVKPDDFKSPVEPIPPIFGHAEKSN